MATLALGKSLATARRTRRGFAQQPVEKGAALGEVKSQGNWESLTDFRSTVVRTPR